jgi:hypothetical protein
VANYAAPNEMTAKTKQSVVALTQTPNNNIWHNIHYAPKILKHNPKLQGSKLFLLQEFLFQLYVTSVPSLARSHQGRFSDTPNC